MDVNIDDYIFTNDNGKKVFRFFDMAIDLGWWVGTGGGKPIDPATFGKTYTGWENAYHTEPKEFFWNTKDGVIQYVFERMKKKDKDPRYTWSQLEYFSLLSVTWGVSSRNVCSAYIGKHYDDDEYIATNIVDFVVSRNDIIILAYVFSTVPKNPEKDPFAGTGLERYHKNDYRLP